MAATVTGTPAAISWGTAQDPTAQNVSIAADATAFYFFWGYYDGGSPGNTGLLSVTLNGVNPSQTFEIANTSSPPQQAGGVAVWYNPPTGTQSLNPAWDAAPSIGPGSIVACTKGGDTSSWRDVDADQAEATDPVTVTLTTVSGDLVLKFDYHFDTPAPALSAGWTNGQTQANENGSGSRLSTISASGVTQVCNSEDEQYSVVVALSIPAAAAGGGVTTKVMSEALSMSDAEIDYVRLVRQQSDSLAANDQLIYGARRGNISSDGILTSDGTVSGAKRGVVASEALTVLDNDIQYLRRVRQGTDTLNVTDGFVSWRRLVRVSQDNIDVLDGYSRTVTGSGTVYGKVMSDTLDVTDGFVSWRRLKRLMADNADILDGFSKTLIGVGIVYAKVMSDVTTLVDDSGQRWTLRTSRLTDSVGLSDQLLRALARIRILGENIEFSDGVIRFLRAVRVYTEPLDIADELVRAYFADQIFNVALVFGHREVMRMSHYDPMNFSAREAPVRFGGR